MAGFANAIYSHVLFATYRTFIRKNTVLLTTAFAGAFAFELWVYIRPDGEYLKLTKVFSISAFDIGSNKIWDSWNQGRQWKDIKHRYMVKEEEDDE
ncbi:unnamed protein product [Penicillium salamii]|uniref:Complex III subunit 9 n=1 Tax=Penicillium salamii TaxID=1612424 RepID=A0A9W4JLD0_9EURO|nr:unnamed protein product [Penicillium salamii]CAG8048971.1 unnamed protein product [Penicillium salamii]CAG8120898.1 unnamed protein product [Penicillium salamii]CAG8253515.1 unnamed protein product [Penicillium salamii]CAG8301117.1 unnamed protein product [Penicillium salamii]